MPEPQPPATSTQHVAEQPVPYTWTWEHVPGIIKRTQEGPEESVTFLKLIIFHAAGRFAMLMLPEDWEKFLTQGMKHLALARSGLTIATELPPNGQGPPSLLPGIGEQR